MRARFARNTDAVFLPAAHKFHAACRGHMQDVESRTGQSRQGNLAVDHDLLGHGGVSAKAEANAFKSLAHDRITRQLEVLRMAEDRLVEHLAVLERSSHDLGVDDRRAVIGEGDSAAVDESADLSQLL